MSRIPLERAIFKAPVALKKKIILKSLNILYFICKFNQEFGAKNSWFVSMVLFKIFEF